MEYPWNEEATLVRVLKVEFSDDQSGEILFEGSLITVALKVRAMPPSERRSLRLSLPNRQVRPHTFQNEALSALIDSIPSTSHAGR